MGRPSHLNHTLTHHTSNFSSINLVFIFRCSSRNPVYLRRVDPSVLDFSLSLYRHSCIWILFTTGLSIYSKKNFRPLTKMRSTVLHVFTFIIRQYTSVYVRTSDMSGYLMSVHLWVSQVSISIIVLEWIPDVQSLRENGWHTTRSPSIFLGFRPYRKSETGGCHYKP